MALASADSSPNDVEYCRDEELVVDGDGHVTGLVEGGRDGAHGVAQVHPPQEEEELGCGGEGGEEESHTFTPTPQAESHTFTPPGFNPPDRL